MKLRKRDFARKLNILKMMWIWTPKWTSKSAFLKTPRGHFMVSLSKNIPSRHMSWQWNVFLISVAFNRWPLECQTASQNFFVAGNRKYGDFHKKQRGRLQNPADMEIMAVASTWNFSFSNVLNMIYRCGVTLNRICSQGSDASHAHYDHPHTVSINLFRDIWNKKFQLDATAIISISARY